MKETKKQLSKIISLCKKGDSKAQKTIFEMFGKDLFTVCCRYSSSTQEAEDMLIEGFTRAFEKINLFTDSGIGFYSWLRTLMVNNCINYIKKYNKKEPIIRSEFLDDEYTDSLQEDDTNKVYTQEFLLQCIQKLPPTCRSVFNMYAIEEMSCRDIAIRLEISEASVKTNIYKARIFLQKCLNEFSE